MLRDIETYIFFKSLIYYTGCIGRLWQVQSTYLNKREMKRERERKTNIGKSRKGGEGK